MQKLVLFLLIFQLLSCGESITDMPNPPGGGGGGTGGDVTPTVSLDPISIEEGNEDRAFFASIRLSDRADATVSVEVETVDGSAVAGEDYVGFSGTIEFAAGTVQENIRLELIGDDESELDETFTLRIVSATGADLGVAEVDVTIENDDAGNGSVVIPATGFTTPESYPNMDLIWSDEFDGATLDLEFWTHERGNGYSGWGNNELQFYQSTNTSIVDGNLVITAREEPFGGFNYTSSRIITEDKFEFQYGRVDIRAVLPEGQGIWPALWTLGANFRQVGWPRCGEMDIMELVGHRPSTTHATVHYAGPGGEFLNTGNETNINGKFSEEYHVFSMIWSENDVRFLVDDRQYHRISPSIIGSQNAYPFNAPFFFIFNVAVGGNWPGSPDATTFFPQNMIVDYVRVFQDQ